MSGAERASTVLASRLDAHLLGRHRAGTPEEVVERLVAVQAQDPRAFRLAIRARSLGCTVASVEDALSVHRTLVVSWLCRGTLHLVGAAEYWWLHRLTAPRQLTANARRLSQLGVDDAQVDAAVDLILAEVQRAPKTRAELAAAVDGGGLPSSGPIIVHLLAAASFRAHLVRGPMRGGEHCFVDAEHWLHRPPGGEDHDQLLATLARRYLAGHGPATPLDLAAFCGITLGDARRAFAALSAETGRLGDDLVRLDAHALEQRPPAPRLLGMFDPVLHGWADRSFVLGEYPDAVTSNGMFRATALVGGRVAGTWTMPAGVVTLDTARKLPSAVRDELEREAADVLRFLQLAPAPLRLVD